MHTLTHPKSHTLISCVLSPTILMLVLRIHEREGVSEDWGKCSPEIWPSTAGQGGHNLSHCNALHRHAHHCDYRSSQYATKLSVCMLHG